jgi:hypothetical protein
MEVGVSNTHGTHACRKTLIFRPQIGRKHRNAGHAGEEDMTQMWAGNNQKLHVNRKETLSGRTQVDRQTCITDVSGTQASRTRNRQARYACHHEIQSDKVQRGKKQIEVKF